MTLPFCAGCGIFTIIDTFLRAVYELGHEDLSGFVFCSGIGCSSWIPSPYFKADSIHTPHGRSIPVATGIKLFNPSLDVVIFGGDGDMVGIGTNHFVHAARRNLDVLAIMVNNMIYGMTGGQVAPTTPFGTKTTTTPYGSIEQPLDAAKLAAVAGASYSARWTTAHSLELRESIENALQMKGFRFIEILSQCPTAYGRKAGFKNAGEILRWFKKNTVTREQAAKMREEELEGRIIIGQFQHRSRPGIVQDTYSVIKEAQAHAEEDRD